MQLNDTSAPCSRKGIWLIQQLESYKKFPYQDGSAHLTIGYGHMIANGNFEKDSILYNHGVTSEIAFQVGVTSQQAVVILLNDINTKANVQPYINVVLEQHQLDALTCLCFNIGLGNFKKSTVLKYLNTGDIMGAADGFAQWRKVGGKISRGLIKRRLVEIMVFLNYPFKKDGGLPSKQLRQDTSQIINMPFTDTNFLLLNDRLIGEAVHLYNEYLVQ